MICSLLQLAGKKKLLLLIACLLASTLLGVVPFVSVYIILEELLHHAANPSGVSLDTIIRQGWLALIALACSFVTLYLGLLFSHMAAFRILYMLRMQISRHLSRLPLGYFNRKSTGSMKKVIETNVERLENFIAHQIPDSINAVVLPVVLITAMFIVDWRLALAGMVPILFGYVLQGIVFGSAKGRAAVKAYQDALEKMNSAGVEYVNSMPVVKIFNITLNSFAKFKDAITQYRDWTVAYTKVRSADWRLPLERTAGQPGSRAHAALLSDSVAEYIDTDAATQLCRQQSAAKATKEEVIAACKKANCYDFIQSLSNGFDTMVGEGGSTLSGGEKQHISIARALLKDADVILLDEATSALDPENEAAVQQAISRLIENKTVVIVAHRLQTIRHADQIK